MKNAWEIENATEKWSGIAKSILFFYLAVSTTTNHTQ